MELVANIWPVVDSLSGVVQRYFARAYAMEGPDEVIGATLRALAPTDFRMASLFRIPERFKLVSEHGELSGCVTIGTFHAHLGDILEPALQELERGYAPVQGIAVASSTGPMKGVVVRPRFRPDPYLCVTTLIETPEGQLIPQLPG
ncbi:MAG: hypothetical protein KatS3mg082_2943 [Nitrospiraceae bacterium]|nr:MAG: hypothetical protein KatS3mg081_2468 [Gemmatimonadales bacterium]GIW56539.1 MAG: hypothetical protein KatS3mg082_2943 [Nitrospiraceae bacterium]